MWQITIHQTYTSVDPPEYETMVTCAPAIIEGLSSDPKGLATLLFSKRLISVGTFREITELSVLTKHDKAGKLYLALLDKVQVCPRVYRNFIEALKEKDKLFYHDLCESLHKELEHQKQGICFLC